MRNSADSLPFCKVQSIIQYSIDLIYWTTGKAHHVPGQAFQVLVELGAVIAESLRHGALRWAHGNIK